MIKQDIKPHKETYQILPSTPSKFFPLTLKEAKGARVHSGHRPPTQEQYDAALEEWKKKNITAVGQKMYVSFGPTSGWQERIFAGILPIEKAHFQNYTTGPETQIIEVWMPKSDYFTRVCPSQCSLLNKGS